MARYTERLHADLDFPRRSDPAIRRAAAILRAGGTVAFVTETVYGLGANALDPLAVSGIFTAKERPTWDPLIVHIGERGQLSTVAAAVPEPARAWMEQFWPGPLTLLLPRGKAIGDEVTAGRPSVGVRMPRHPVALALLREVALPIAAPSANRFGHVSPTTADHVLADLDGRIDAVLDGGPAEHGIESTVVDCGVEPCLVYRPGAITIDALAGVWPHVQRYRGAEGGVEAAPAAAVSPGLGLRHYAPKAELRLIEFRPEQGRQLLAAIAESEPARTGTMLPDGLLLAEERARLPGSVLVFDWGRWNRPEELAHGLFAGLRALDDAGAERIICPLPPDLGLGVALCDRLRKAARL